MSAAARVIPPNLILYWGDDADAIENGLACIERVRILIEFANLSEVSRERARNWLLEAAESLMRFQTLSGPAP
jgi:hypothetical protein